MKIVPEAVRECLKAFDFQTLFREHLGWDAHKAQLDIPIDGQTYPLQAVSQKRGFTAFVCDRIPDRATRLKIDHQVTKSAREHFIVYADKAAGQQVWQWVRREPGKPLASRDHRFEVSQSGEALVQRLERIAVSMDEEEELTLFDVTGRNRAAFDVDRVTKRFYDRFKAEHTAFLKLISGFPPPVKSGGTSEPHPDLQWYTSLMLNRLMFVYFIQKKGFLDGDTDYLRNRLNTVKQAKGPDKFQSFYRYFLLRLFHDGLGKAPGNRKLVPAMEKLLGRIPYLNGGFFEVHKLERDYTDIDIPDAAFVRLFDFFDQYNWHLDERPLRKDDEINPDVVGYIFEKYINQKQMGAYYTKEDITEYISKNTIIPYLFDAARKKCAIAFKSGSALWRLLADDPDRYIYASVRQGVVDEKGEIIPLPADVEAGVADVSKRDGWNRAADAPYALPTETWREHVARRQRCLEIRQKLRRGEVEDINDLITLNLDIWQFARDVIVNAEGPELVRAFWQAIQSVTVLDPTCGSGAFVFAALRILETLYSDCLERMERFVEDDDARMKNEGGRMKGQKFSDFRATLAQIAEHPNERYFILKSIIINNLFGVDIMEEAVEICKLRLFLKLVAQVETFEQLEPLPDVDFNIRAGNTLVGFASMDQVKQSMQGDMLKILELPRIEESAELAARAFTQFRAQQTTHGGLITSEEKQALRERLRALDDELDRYLATEYGVKFEKPGAFDAWKASHQPFHWLVEFYSIMQAGGFDVIIGNPPYVEYKTVKNSYRILGYSTEETGNLYAYAYERAVGLAASTGLIGFIIPVASVSTAGYSSLRRVWLASGDLVISNFNDRPGKLFDGLEHIRLSIVLLMKNRHTNRQVYVSSYMKWFSETRNTLFQVLRFADVTALVRTGDIPKCGIPLESSILGKLSCSRNLNYYASLGGGSQLYYTRKLSHFVQILDFVPSISDGEGHSRAPSELKEIRLSSYTVRDAYLCCLNSTLFYWLLTVWSDCRNLNKREVYDVPFDYESASESTLKALAECARLLMADFLRNARIIKMRYENWGTMEIQCIYPKNSKPIIDEIDRVLAEHYGFTDEELDFIINYDIKYRMGGAEEE